MNSDENRITTDQLKRIKYNIPISTDPNQVSKVETKKTKSLEKRKTNVEQMNLENKATSNLV